MTSEEAFEKWLNSRDGEIAQADAEESLYFSALSAAWTASTAHHAERVEELEAENGRLMAVLQSLVNWQDSTPGESLTINNLQGELDSLAAVIDQAREALASK